MSIIDDLKISLGHTHSQENTCPCCGCKIECSTEVMFDEDAQHKEPIAGDVTICMQCLNWLVFGQDMILREMNEEEISNLPHEIFNTFVKLSNAITSLRKAKKEEEDRKPKPPFRVGCVADVDGRKVRFFGYGLYVGDEVPPPGLLAPLNVIGIPSPKIILDNGKTIYGCECWWAPEAQIANRLASDCEVTIVDVDDMRREFNEQEEKGDPTGD